MPHPSALSHLLLLSLRDLIRRRSLRKRTKDAPRELSCNGPTSLPQEVDAPTEPLMIKLEIGRLNSDPTSCAPRTFRRDYGPDARMPAEPSVTPTRERCRPTSSADQQQHAHGPRRRQPHCQNTIGLRCGHARAPRNNMAGAALRSAPRPCARWPSAAGGPSRSCSCAGGTHAACDRGQRSNAERCVPSIGDSPPRQRPFQR